MATAWLGLAAVLVGFFLAGLALLRRGFSNQSIGAGGLLTPIAAAGGYVPDSVADLLPVLDDIEARLREGQVP